ncbi:GGDEF domain-containing protein [Roseibacterium sp. SDUM158016]|uniref:GGDEF domain-containing protein n=1 Tax=Roseicyclus sediminis TaxID=2980997 RepID=UPI0021D13F4C|nr:GGDEF domain-containing protein [Roseibacterium sp. SDUM158016]MCU4654034.1 GGDEF domain-containing protein [Roseibacterium sp. SDUM158016]
MSGYAGGLDVPGAIGPAVLDRLLPMHLRIAADGTILGSGPTLVQMCGGERLDGMSVFDVLELRRPGAAADMPALMALAGQRLTLALRVAPDHPLRGVVAALPRGGGALLDVSLGPGFARAVTHFGLTISDFSPCDQTVELLYLQEANAAIGRLSRQLTERISIARATAERQALTDPLTGLANRRAMDAELSRLLADPEARLSLLHIDLDFFKQVNDTRGHAAGDRVLLAVADVLREEMRRMDLAARVGGDEFLVILRETVASDALAAAAARLIRRIETPVAFEGALCRVSASIGIATTDAYDHRPTADRLIADTDAALYRAKEAGRARFAIHGEAPPARPPSRAG